MSTKEEVLSKVNFVLEKILEVIESK